MVVQIYAAQSGRESEYLRGGEEEGGAIFRCAVFLCKTLGLSESQNAAVQHTAVLAEPQTSTSNNNQASS